MTDQPEPPKGETPAPVGPLPEAHVKKSRASWLLWLVPLGAVALCAWFVYRDFVATGPMITIYFRNAEGLEENNTPINFRGSQVGQVRTLELTGDNQFVKVRARLTGSGAQLAREGSEFWIVRPELKVGSVSGLRTIISGEYVAVRPGSGARTNVFFAVDREPLEEQPGALPITLLASDLGSLQELSPVFYRGIQVGEVTDYQLGKDAREVLVHARIRAEYTPLVRLNSVFWNAGGINFRFGLFSGAQINAASPAALVTGGIEFATPPDFEAPATSNAAFRIYDKPKDEWRTWAPVIPLRLSGAPEPQRQLPGLPAK